MILSIAFKYIFKKLLGSLFIISPIVILMVWITMSIKYVNLIASDNVSIFTFFKLVLCIFPGVSGVILPICFLISSIIVIQKMQTDKEIVVFMTSGKSSFSVFKPLFVLACCVAGLILYIQTIGSPQAYKAFEDLQEQIKNKVSVTLLKPGAFNVMGESVIYIGERNDKELKNVFISYIPNNQTSHTNIITAQTGKYLSEKGKIFVILNNGYRQELSKSNEVIATLKFENFSYDITQFFKRFYARSKRPNEKTQSELMEQAKQAPNMEIKRNCIAEYHSRFISSFLPILNAMIVAIFLIVAQERGRGKLESIMGFFSGILCQVFVMILVNSSTKNSAMIPYNYFIIFFTMVSLFTIFMRRKI